MTEPPAYRPSLHRYLVVVTGTVLLMIVAGGMVTSMDAGDAVPDWPLSYNSLLPPMVGNIFYEHGHRMTGWLLGALMIGLAVWLKLAERRQWVRGLGYIALAAVCLQGALGGLRVLIVSSEPVQNALLPSPTGESVATARTVIAVIHTASGQAILCLLAVLTAATSRSWIEADEPTPAPNAGRLRNLCIATVAVVVVQLVLGALRRHVGGTIMWHLGGAAVVALHVALLVRCILLSFNNLTVLVRPAVMLLVALALQLALGTASWLLTASAAGGPRAEMMGSAVAGSAILTAHVALGAVFLALGVVLSARSFRHVTPSETGSRALAGDVAAKGRVAPA